MMSAFLIGLSVKAKPPQNEATLLIIKDFAARDQKATGYALVTWVSPVADLTCDFKKEGKTAAVECMTAIFNCTGDKNLEPFLPFDGGCPVHQADAWLRGEACRLRLRSERRDAGACCHPASALPRAERQVRGGEAHLLPRRGQHVKAC